jgi:hypothetical protein
MAEVFLPVAVPDPRPGENVELGLIWDDAANEIVGLYGENDTEDFFTLDIGANREIFIGPLTLARQLTNLPPPQRPTYRPATGADDPWQQQRGFAPGFDRLHVTRTYANPRGNSPTVLSSSYTEFFAGPTTTHNITLPGTVDANDLLILEVFITGTSTITSTGFTEIGTDTNGDRLAILAKKAVGDEDGATQNVQTSASAYMIVHQYQIDAGTWSETLAEVEATFATGTSATPDPPNHTPTGGSADYLWIASGAKSSGTVTSAPTNYTNLINGASGDNMGTARRGLTASSENPGTFGGSTSDTYIAATLSIPPAATGATITGTAAARAAARGAAAGTVLATITGAAAGRAAARAETAANAGIPASLYPTGDDTATSVENELNAASPLAASIDDDPATPTDTDWINNALDPLTATGWLQLYAGPETTGRTGTDYAHTAHKAALDITGDIDVRAKVRAETHAPPAAGARIIEKHDAWNIIITGTGHIRWEWHDGTSWHSLNSSTSLDAVGITAGTDFWINVQFDVNVGGTDAVATFRKSQTANNDPSHTSWTNLGTPQSYGATTSIRSTTTDLIVGIIYPELTEPFDGRIYTAQLRDGIGGTIVAQPDWTDNDQGWEDGSGADAYSNTWDLEGGARWQPAVEAFVDLTDTAGAFGNATAASITARWEAGDIGADTRRLYAQIFTSDRHTPLTGEAELAAAAADAGWANTGALALPDVDTAASKADWDGALLRLQWT